MSDPAAGHVQVTDTDHFDADVLNNPLPVLLDFWGPGCGPCLTLLPGIEKLAAEHAGRLAVFKINSRENWRVAVRLKVSSLPTLLLFKGGAEVARLTGEVTVAGIVKAVEEVEK